MKQLICHQVWIIRIHLLSLLTILQFFHILRPSDPDPTVQMHLCLNNNNAPHPNLSDTLSLSHPPSPPAQLLQHTAALHCH